MAGLEVLSTNLLSPMVLAFALGITATLVKSDLKLPQELYDALTLYLLLAIGLRGGAELSETPLAELAAPLAAAVLLGVLIPLVSYAVLRRLGRFAVADAAAIAAHYGSVSAVTFIAATALLDKLKVPYEGYVPALLATLEIPGILVALSLARWRERRGALAPVFRELATSKSILLLGGGLAIGWIGGHTGYEHVRPFFSDLFKGVLTLFLLELGMVAARRLRDLARVGPFLVGFGVVMPVVFGALGALAGFAAGLSLGGTAVLATLAGSASYIAAPAAVRVALPEANPSLYLTAALAITFPFNLSLGIPLYLGMARWLCGG